MFANRARRDERGQVLVIVAMSMVVLVAMVGVVIDGGYAWGKQRDTQNAADAIAKAGAVKLTENLAGRTPANTDADVLDAMQDTADANVVGHAGRVLHRFRRQHADNPGGTPTTNENAAAEVGNGSIPPNAAGVRARADQSFDTFLARVIGFNAIHRLGRRHRAIRLADRHLRGRCRLRHHADHHPGHRSLGATARASQLR